jgi:FtsX-like permease family
MRVLRGDRRTQVATLLTSLGVMVATALVLLLSSLPSATEVRAQRALWQDPPPGMQVGENGTVSWSATEDEVDGLPVTRVDVAPLVGSEDLALPPGIDRLPGQGEMLRSPELAALADSRPAVELADRFAEEPVGLLGDEALRFPEQLVVLVGHAPDTMPAGAIELTALTGGDAEVDGLLALLAGVGLVVLLVPSLVLVASASRLIAARRERRLAALRLAGATPAQVTGMVAAETGVAAVAGAALGVAISPLLHRLATLVPWDGGTWYPGDFVLAPSTVAVVAVLLVVLVVGAAVAGLRRVVTAPLMATGGHTRKPLSVWRLLIVPAAVALFFWTLTRAGEDESILPLLLALGVLMWSPTVVGPWLTSALGSVFVRVWRRPSALLAGRRLRDDPKAAYRASAGVVLATFAGAMALTLMPNLEGTAGYHGQFRDEVVYLSTSEERADGIVADVDERLAGYGVAARASRVDEGELTAGEESTTAMVVTCEDAKRLLPGTDGLACLDTPAVYADATAAELEQVGLPADTPVVAPPKGSGLVIVDPALWPDGAPLLGVSVAVPADATNGAAVRTALLAGSGGEQVISRETTLGDQDAQLRDLRRLTVIGLVTASLLAGVSAAIATAGSVMDRRRTFGALMAAGTPVGTLARALRAEAALPAMVATIGAGALGTVVGVGLFGLVSDAPAALSPWVAAPVALGALVAMIAASVCAPALRRVRAEPLAEE